MFSRRRAAWVDGGVYPEFVGWKLATAGSLSTAGGTVAWTGLSDGIDSAPSSGDFLLVAFGAVTDDDDVTLAIRKDNTSGAAYTLAGSEFYIDGGIDTNFRVGYRFHDGDTNVFIDTDMATLPIIVFVTAWRGVDITTPLDVTPTTSSSTVTSQIAAPSITPITSKSIAVFFGACAEETSIATPLTYSGTATDTLIGRITSVNDTVQGIAGYYEWPGGVYSPALCGGSTPVANRSYAAMSLALRPA